MQLQEKHSVRFDSSQEVQEVLLLEGAADWRTATKRHEDEAAQFGGVVANPGSRRSMGKAFCAHTKVPLLLPSPVQRCTQHD